MFTSLTLIQKIAVCVIPVLFAITLHEAAHALVANLLGDPTAKMLGRVSLNPIKHIDLFGTVIIPITIGVLSGFSFIFGWAKPVPITEQNFKKPRRDMALATAAGPMSNFLMAIFWMGLLKVLYSLNIYSETFWHYTAQVGVIINLILAFLNLLPIPPLDGSRIVASLLPPKYAYYFMKIEPYGFIILLISLMLGILPIILYPLLKWSLTFLHSLFGL